MARVVCIGEAMIELAEGVDRKAFRYGGDTLNTTVHLARLGHDAAYFTALGKEPASIGLRESWQAEGIDCSLVLTHPEREVGVYGISTGENGERQFSYWRDESAAREMFVLPESAAGCERAAECDLLYFSLVSLAVQQGDGRERLLELARRTRDAGAIVAFDSNYRPVLWSGRDEARRWRDAAIALADIGLPTWEDEAALEGAVSPDDIAAHWRDLGCKEVVVKMGARGCLLPGGELLPVPARLTPLDTSGAGDAFDAGYLAARLNGADPRRAAEVGQRVAAWTIMRRGAIPPRDSRYPASAA